MQIGYARVSTDDQDTAVQVAALKTAECERIYREKASGGRWDRPELHRLLDQLRKGDVLVVWKLDRLSRSLRDVLTIMEQLGESGTGFRSLTEAIDTTTPAGRMMMQMVGAFADNAEFAIMRSRSTEVALRPAFQRWWAPHYPGSNNEAISASGALNWPRRKPSGNTASTASNFSDGSTRR